MPRFNKLGPLVERMLVVVVERMLVAAGLRMRGVQVLGHGTAVVGHMELGQRLGRTRPINFVGISVKNKKEQFCLFRNISKCQINQCWLFF